MKFKALVRVVASQLVEVEVSADDKDKAVIKAQQEAEFSTNDLHWDVDESDVEEIECIEQTEAELALEERRKALAAGQKDMFEGVL